MNNTMVQMEPRAQNNALRRKIRAITACSRTKKDEQLKKRSKWTKRTIPGDDKPNMPNICRPQPSLRPTSYPHGEPLPHRDYHVNNALSPHFKEYPSRKACGPAPWKVGDQHREGRGEAGAAAIGHQRLRRRCQDSGPLRIRWCASPLWDRCVHYWSTIGRCCGKWAISDGVRESSKAWSEGLPETAQRSSNSGPCNFAHNMALAQGAEPHAAWRVALELSNSWWFSSTAVFVYSQQGSGG